MEEEPSLNKLQFRSPMRSLSFEDSEGYLIADVQKHPCKEYKGNIRIDEEHLLDTHENNENPDIPTISCHTV